MIGASVYKEGVCMKKGCIRILPPDLLLKNQLAVRRVTKDLNRVECGNSENPLLFDSFSKICAVHIRFQPPLRRSVQMTDR